MKMNTDIVERYLAQLKAVVDLVLEGSQVDGPDQACVHGRLRVKRRQQAAQLAASPAATGFTCATVLSVCTAAFRTCLRRSERSAPVRAPVTGGSPVIDPGLPMLMPAGG